MKIKSAIFIFFLRLGTLHAATWVGGNTGDETAWDDPMNWTNPATPPNATDAVAAFATSTFSPTLNGMNITLGTISLSSADTYTIQQGANNLIFKATSPAAVITMNGSGTLTITATANSTGVITLSSPLSITQDSSGNLNLQSPLQGSKLLTISGTGTVILSNASNTYSAGTTITSGVVSVTANGALGSGTVTVDTSTLQFDNGGGLSFSNTFTLSGSSIIDATSGTTVTITGAIGGTGSLQKTDSGTLNLNNASNSYSGGTTISAGELDVSADGDLGASTGSLNFGGGTLKTISANFTSARSGTLTGASTFNVNGLSDTLSGNFNGTGSITISGGGTLTLSGTNSYAGPTTVTGTALVGNTNSLVNTISVDNTSSITFNQSFNGAFGGALQGAGTLTVTGGGTVTLSGTSTLSGNTTITGGTLNVTGSLSSSQVTANAGTTLTGTGTVGRTIISANAALSPGSGATIGTLSTNGNLTLTAPSTFTIGITPTINDAVAVTGTANLSGGNLVVSPSSGFYNPNTTYTILTSTNALATTFASYTSSNSNFAITSISYANSKVVITVHALSPFFEFVYSNKNTKAVGENINALSAINAIPPALNSLLNLFAGQSTSAINEALDQMHPANYSAYSEVQEELGARIINLFHRRPSLTCGCDRSNNRLWVKPFGNTLTEKRHGKWRGFTANTAGIALGYDGEVANDLYLGAGAIYDNTHLEWRDDFGHGLINGVYGSLYADYQVWNFYFGGAFLAGADIYDTTRRISFFGITERAHSSYTGYDIVAQLSTAYYFGAPMALLYPYANFDFLYLHEPSFSEEGAPGLNLNVGSHTASTFRTEMGLAFQIQDKNYDETICISPLFGISWVNMIPIRRENYHSNFQGAPISFTTFGWDEGWNLFSLDFGLTVKYWCFSTAIEYNIEMSADEKTLLYNQNADIRFDWKW